MAFTTCSVTTSVIAALDDLPNDVGGLTAAQLKAKFDEFGTNFVAWFNATHMGTDKIHIGNNPSARVYHNTDQSIPNGADTVISFNSERYDGDAIHDTSTNNSRLTCKTAGKYFIAAGIEWGSSSATGVRKAEIRLNGTTVIARSYHAAVEYLCQGVSCVYDLAVNDYIEVYVRQNAGVSLNVVVDPNASPEFMMVRVG